MSEFDKGIKLESQHNDIYMTDVMIKPIGREKILSISSLMSKHTSELEELRKEVAETKTSFKELDTFIAKNYIPLSTLKQVIEDMKDKNVKNIVDRKNPSDIPFDIEAQEDISRKNKILSDVLTAITKIQEGK